METEYNVYINNAIRWAMKQLDSKEYPFKCLAFVEDAYETSNNIEMFGGDCAGESAGEYEAEKNSGEPPVGSFVFYDCFGTLFDTYKNWGHVGLFIGEGKVVHAWDRVRIDCYLDVQNLNAAPGWTKPHYIGWAPVERVLQGYIKK